jgi:putative hydrolase of the HAD superfamily
MPFETIFLDAGGVLVWPNWTRVRDALRTHSIEIDPGALAAADPVVRKSLDDAGMIAAAADQRRSWNYFELVLTNAGVTLSLAAEAALARVHDYQRTANIWEHVPDFVPPALQTLRSRGHKLVVVSNSNGTVRESFRRLGLAGLVDLVVDSAEEGFEKPDRRLFDVALERAGAQAETTLHAGDFYFIDVVGARAAGLTPVLVDQSGLYPEADCERIQSIAELPDLIGRLSSRQA